jgi:Zn-dependent protease with chaperone function
MGDLCPLIIAVVFSYVATAAGSVIGLMLRWWWSKGRCLSSMEATLCAFLPLMSLTVLTVSSFCLPFAAELPDALHSAWHSTATAAIEVPYLHGSLHAANVFALLLACMGVARVVHFLARQQSVVESLRSVNAREEVWCGSPVFRIATHHAMCFTVGLFRTRIYVSEGLLERLSDRERAAVLAHEQAHVARCDGLIEVLLNVIFRLFPLPGCTLLYGEWRRAAERACDVAASKHVGGPYDVASALVKVARFGIRPPLPGLVSFAACESGSEQIEDRVRWLLSPATSALANSQSRSLAAIVLLIIAFLILFEPLLYHAVESFVYH